MQKKTVGAQAIDLLQKTPESRDPIELQREMQKDYIDHLEWSVRHMQKKVDCSHLIGNGRGHEECAKRPPHEGDFYVVILLKKEKLLENVLRNYFLQTISCPTPTWDQTVYKYHKNDDKLEYLWTVPDRETCLTFQENAPDIVPEEKWLLRQILEFHDGTLLRLARKLNGENIETGIILEGQQYGTR